MRDAVGEALKGHGITAELAHPVVVAGSGALSNMKIDIAVDLSRRMFQYRRTVEVRMGTHPLFLSDKLKASLSRDSNQ